MTFTHLNHRLRQLMAEGFCTVCGGDFQPGTVITGGLNAHGDIVLAGECCASEVTKIITLGRMMGQHILFAPPEPPDDDWFTENPTRSHRIRAPFTDEIPAEAPDAPGEFAAVVLVRQTEPGIQLRAPLLLAVDILPVPDNEAIIHALFEVAAGTEPLPPSGAAFGALVNKYRATERWN
jgi:hypothetical protein